MWLGVTSGNSSKASLTFCRKAWFQLHWQYHPPEFGGYPLTLTWHNPVPFCLLLCIRNSWDGDRNFCSFHAVLPLPDLFPSPVDASSTKYFGCSEWLHSHYQIPSSERGHRSDILAWYPQMFGNALGLFGKFGFSAFSSREKVYNAPVFPPWRGVAESQQHSLAYLASITCVRCLWTL